MADFAAAAHLSCLDYTGDVPWKLWPVVRDWYARIKSRPSFQAAFGGPCGRHAPAALLRRFGFLKMTAAAQLKEQICDAAAAQGFDACHIVSAKAMPKAVRACKILSRPAITGKWPGWKAAWMSAPRRKNYGRSAKRHHAGGQLRPRMRPVGGLER